MTKSNTELLKGRCPHCHGDVLPNYKNRPWLGKCSSCSQEVTLGRKPADYTEHKSNAEQKRAERFVARNMKRDIGG